MRLVLTMILPCLVLGTAWADDTKAGGDTKPAAEKKKMEIATFGAGCFWCVEAVFQRIKGVEKVISGYEGGFVPNPTYKQVCTKKTGHAEVCQIHYDPALVSFEQLLEVFWRTHDPTTPNQQGADKGPQYRSVVFYHSDVQKELAESYKEKLDESGSFDAPIVTEISPSKTFYAAEDNHQDYFNQNPGNSYCHFVIVPKLAKFKQVFADKLKEE